jgi:hypothetical protein
MTRFLVQFETEDDQALIKTGPPNGLSARMIADQFEQKPNWFTGVLNGGIQRNVKSAGFQLEDVVVITRYRGMITYAPGPELKRRELESLPPSPAYAPIDGHKVNEALHLGD